MKRSAFLAALALALAVPASAMAYTSPTWNLDGTYTIPFTCVTGCPSPPDYPYSVTITGTSDTTGAFTGTGYYITGGGYPEVTATGDVDGWDVMIELSYTDPGLSAYNPFVLTGSIDRYGGMSGTATDGNGRTFTWRTTSGSVGLFSPRCDYGTYPLATRVWSGFAPSSGGVVTTTALEPGHDYFIEASGTYFAGGDGMFDIQADAEYSQDAYQRANSLAWTSSVHLYEGFGDVLLDLLVDGQNVDWGSYSSSHRYTLDVVPTGDPLQIGANIYDTYAPNNTGGICVAVYVRAEFTGFFAPVDNLPTMNSVKAGSAIPVKFSLGGDWGLDIFAAGYPKSEQIACTTGASLDNIENTVNAGGSSLSYDPVADQYVYVWKTDKSWAGTCRQLVAKLADGTYHRANFQFK